MNYSVSIIGAGSYGTALSISLARNGRKVLLWGYDAKEVAQMRQERCNNFYLPNISFPDSLDLTNDMQEAVQACEILLVVVPSKAFREVLERIKPYLTPKHRVAWATKGLEPKTGRLLSEVAQEILGKDMPLVAISGPTFAKELAIGLPTAIAVAGTIEAFSVVFSQLIHSSNYFRVC